MFAERIQAMIKPVSIIILAIALLASASACNKDNTNNPPTLACDSCYCKALIDTLQLQPAETDSAVVIAQLKGLWELKCVSFTSKYGNTSLTHRDSLNDVLSVQFTDSTYTYFQDDSLLFTHNYFVSDGGFIRSNGNSFYFGNLGSSIAGFKQSMMGINTVYPFTGSYYLTFKKKP
jgi:hypothetical protein